MNNYKTTINNIEEHIKALHSRISNELFFTSNDLSDTFDINNIFEDMHTEFNNYKDYIYALDAQMNDNIFEDELLAEFNIKE